MADGSVLAAGGLPEAPIARMMGGGGADSTVLAPLVGGLNPTITEMKGGAIIQVFGRPVEVRDTIVMPLTDSENEILATWSFTPDMGAGALPEDDQKIAFLEALKVSCTKDVDINDARCKPIRASLEQLAKRQLERLSPGAELASGSGKFTVDVNGLIKIEFTTIAAPPAAITPVAGTGTGDCPADSTCIKNDPFVEGAAFTNVISRIVASTNPAADISANITDFSGGFLKVSNTPSFADSATIINRDGGLISLNGINLFLFSKMMEIKALSNVDVTIKENIQNQFAKFIRLFAQNNFIDNLSDNNSEISDYIMNVPDPAAAPTHHGMLQPLPLPKIFSVIEGQQQKINEFNSAIIKYKQPGQTIDVIFEDIQNYLSDPTVAWDLSTDDKLYAFMRLLDPTLPATGAFATATSGASATATSTVQPPAPGGNPPAPGGNPPAPGGTPPAASTVQPPAASTVQPPAPGGNPPAPPPQPPVNLQAPIAAEAARRASEAADRAATARGTAGTQLSEAQAQHTIAISPINPPRDTAAIAAAVAAATAASTAATAAEAAATAAEAAANEAATAANEAAVAADTAVFTAVGTPNDAAASQSATEARVDAARAQQSATEARTDATEARRLAIEANTVVAALANPAASSTAPTIRTATSRAALGPTPVRRQIAPLSQAVEEAQQVVQEQGGGSRRQVKKRKLRATRRKSKQ